MKRHLTLSVWLVIASMVISACGDDDDGGELTTTTMPASATTTASPDQTTAPTSSGGTTTTNPGSTGGDFDPNASPDETCGRLLSDDEVSQLFGSPASLIEGTLNGYIDFLDTVTCGWEPPNEPSDPDIQQLLVVYFPGATLDGATEYDPTKYEGYREVDGIGDAAYVVEQEFGTHAGFVDGNSSGFVTYSGFTTRAEESQVIDILRALHNRVSG